MKIYFLTQRTMIKTHLKNRLEIILKLKWII